MPPGRFTAYLECPVRRTDQLHIYKVEAPNAPSHPLNMQSTCSANDQKSKKPRQILPFPEGSPTAGRGPKKKFGKTDKTQKMAASSIQCIFTGCRGPIDKGTKKKVFKLDTFSKKAVSKIEVDRELDSLHFKSVF